MTVVQIGPLHKRNFRLTDGACLNDAEYSIISFDIKQENDNLLILLPEPEELDDVIGTSKWMVKRATAEVVSRGGGQGIEIATVEEPPTADTATAGCSGSGSSCGGNSALEW
jgi:nitrite reductase (NAD(P)H)